MTSDRRPTRRRILGAAALAAALGCASPLRAEPSYPFEGTWVRANRACTAAAPLARTYTAREVTGANTHCAFRKVASGGGQFEIFEDCRRADHPGNFTETIRMAGPDAMVVRRQRTRLKIARPLRYIRCSIAAPASGPAPVRPVAPHHPGPAAEEKPGAKPAETPKPAEPPKP